MKLHPGAQDLIVLVADLDCRLAVQALLGRHAALGIRQVSYVVEKHPERDSGCFRTCHDLLRERQRQFHYALVMFDREGCGREGLTTAELEQDVVLRLEQSGWRDRCEVVVLDPELEAWVWSPSPHVDRELGWHDHSPDLRAWLLAEGRLDDRDSKPARPKEALQAALREVRVPWSSDIHARLAQKVGVGRCIDPAFLKFKQTLHKWFSGDRG